MPRLQVILSEGEQQRFDAYCEATGHKKSTLTARLIRDHLDKAGFTYQPPLIAAERSAERPGRRPKAGKGQP